GRLPPGQQASARRLGLGLALVTRLLLLFTLSWIIGLTQPLFSLADLGIPETWVQRSFSWRDLILLAGGAFLIGKSTFEIHHKLEGDGDHRGDGRPARFGVIVTEIAVLDIVFSLDSVITAVGMVLGEAKDGAPWDRVWIMVTAIVISVVVMLFFAGAVGRFVHRHPTLKMLALSFLILIGVMLVADGIGQHIPHRYIYFAMV